MSLINVIGLGYIGLPTALMLASKEVEVVGTDYNVNLIETLKRGELTFEEKGMRELFDNALKNNIKFTTKYVKTDIYVVAVPTPYNNDTKKIDTSYIKSAIEEILLVSNKGAIVVVESTISPGTIDRHIRPFVESKGFIIGEDIHLVHAPERIIPGNMVYELEHNSRTIGADDLSIAEKVKQVYESFCKGEIVLTDIRTAEMTKVVENTYRDINIAFANELAQICRSDNMDVHEIVRIANKHPRVNILTPGPGVGGHCISVDPWFLVGDYPMLTDLILQARKTNDGMPRFVLKRIREIMDTNGITDVSRVGLYGLSYKENVDDTRESPTLQLLDIMRDNLASPLKTFDPHINKNIIENQYQDFNEFLNDVDMVVVMVAHNHIKANLELIEDKVIYDTKNAINLKGVHKLWKKLC